MPSPVLSVCVITFNHEKYIGQTIDSILEQKTTFPFELVIGEDCSTDSTKEICEKYQNQEPEKIRLLHSEKNLGVMKNFIKTLHSCEGKYIALCDGDDYWVNPFKLQKQVDFLEEHEDFSICFHEVKVLVNGKLTKDKTTNVPGSVSTLYDLGKKNYIHTPSCVFRNNKEVIARLKLYEDLEVGDYPLHLYNAKKGKIKYFDEPMAVYRKHPGSNWSRQGNEYIVEKFNNLLSKLIYSGDFKEIEPFLKNQMLENNWSLFMQNIDNSPASGYLQKLVEEDATFVLNKMRNLFDNNNRSLIEKGLKKIFKQLAKK